MKRKKFVRIILLSALVIILVMVGIGVFLVATAPKLPPDTDAIIAEVLRNDPPELVTGRTGYADSDGVSIWYETRPSESNQASGTVLLIAGHSMSALYWPRALIRDLVRADFKVIRFDHRGLGLSDWMADWDSDTPYTLFDMAQDTLSVLDANGVSQAHVVGMSMGGTIAMRLAAAHPHRVASLTTIMSSNDMANSELPNGFLRFGLNQVKLFLKYGAFAAAEADSMKIVIGTYHLLRGDGKYAIDIRELAENTLVSLRERKGFNWRCGQQHTMALYRSGSWNPALENITCPVLAIHGMSDALLPLVHAQKYTSQIPQAKTLWIEGMGHDLPSPYLDEISEAIVRHIKSASHPDSWE